MPYPFQKKAGRTGRSQRRLRPVGPVGKRLQHRVARFLGREEGRCPTATTARWITTAACSVICSGWRRTIVRFVCW